MSGDYVTIEIDEAAFKAALTELRDGVHRAVAMGVDEAAAHAKSEHRWKSKTGATVEGIRGVHLSSSAVSADGVIESLAKHSTYLEEGTKPHEIWPKLATAYVGPARKGQGRRSKARTALRWFDPGGEIHFARMVNHPGTESMPFMGPAVLKFERVAIREIEVGIAKANAILSK